MNGIAGMNPHQLVMVVFGLVLVGALVLDLGILSKRNKVVTIAAALWQTLFWVLLALAFFVFMYVEEGHKLAIEYLSAYLMEWSLSIDNIFIFILIFTSFGIKEKYYGQVLLLGILMAIGFRVLFITIGVSLVERVHELLYVFGAFLLYTGYKMFVEDEAKTVNAQENKVYKFLKRFLPVVPHDGNGKYIIRNEGKPEYTILFVVVIVLATVDIVFALDSIPAVMGISQSSLVIYTSNIFAVLGLRSLFFLLRGAVNQFHYLPKGIAIVLVFIGVKMLGEVWIDQWFNKSMQTILSLIVIVLCIGGGILYSLYVTNKKSRKKLHE